VKSRNSNNVNGKQTKDIVVIAMMSFCRIVLLLLWRQLSYYEVKTGVIESTDNIPLTISYSNPVLLIKTIWRLKRFRLLLLRLFHL
jgi:hypothetical protein